MSTVDPGRLLKELRKLWLDLGKEAPDGVLRACAMTLLVVADEAVDAQWIGETIASLMHEHPSRAIVIRVRHCEERVMSARVFAQCWMPFGRRQQICCEQVEIIASPAELTDAATVVRALLAPDLPVILYAPSESLWDLPQFASLLPLAGRLIIDSCGMRQSTRAIHFLRGLPHGSPHKSDLMWTRLTPWREAVAQVFENPSRLARVHDLTEVRILYKGSEEPSAVYYLAGWFMHVLGAGVPIRIARGVGPEYAGIAHIAVEGPNVHAEIDVAVPYTVETRIEGESPQVSVWPVANNSWALHQELKVVARDRIFEDAAGLAHLMLSAA